jgi:hypothetical protein
VACWWECNLSAPLQNAEPWRLLDSHCQPPAPPLTDVLTTHLAKCSGCATEKPPPLMMRYVEQGPRTMELASRVWTL